MKHTQINFVAGPTFVVKKVIFDKIKFEARNTGEDSSFLKNIVDAGYKIYAADPFNFIQYRSDPKNHTWNIADEDLLKGTSTEIVSDGFNKRVVSF